VEKKTKAISVKMTPSDWELLKVRARQLWPGAHMTNSEIMLSLAMRGAGTAKAAIPVAREKLLKRERKGE
jgi:hypothetical protein